MKIPNQLYQLSTEEKQLIKRMYERRGFVVTFSEGKVHLKKGGKEFFLAESIFSKNE